MPDQQLAADHRRALALVEPFREADPPACFTMTREAAITLSRAYLDAMDTLRSIVQVARETYDCPCCGMHADERGGRQHDADCPIGLLEAQLEPLCRRCSECQGQEHHWLIWAPEFPEDDEGTGEPFIPCKHCDAKAGICEECEGPVYPVMSSQPICTECKSRPKGDMSDG